MSRFTLDRRTLLRGMLGGSAVMIGLPALEVMLNPNGTAYASGDAFPTRFGLFYWGNGMLPDFWAPSKTGSGDDWELSEQLAALAPHKDVLSVISGFDVKVENNSPHMSGACGMLTGQQIADPEDNGSFPGPTVDRFLASELGRDTRFRSIEYGATSVGLSYDGPHDRAPAENNPFALYQRLFGPGFLEPGEEPIIDPRWALRRSALDAVSEDAKRLKARVSVSDRQRIDKHLEGIRELELRLARLEADPPDLAACKRPAEPLADYPDIAGRPQLVEKNKIMSELVAMAFACDQARVASNWLTNPVSDVLFPEATMGHHQLTHDEPGDQPEVNAIVKQIMGIYGGMIQAFRDIEEGDGTVLDHSVILATSDVSLGRTHSLLDYPFLLAGSANGKLKTNLHVRNAGGGSTSQPTLSVIRAMGVSAQSWGTNDNEATEGLGEIEA